MTSQDIKTYIAEHNISQLFECLMTALMYNRPSDPPAFLSKCLTRLQGSAPERITWDLLLNGNSQKKKDLSPMDRQSSQDSLNGSSAGPKQLGAAGEPLPPISPKFEDFVASIVIDKIQLDCNVIFALTTPGSSKRTLFQRVINTLQNEQELAFAKWHVVNVSNLVYQFLNAATVFHDDPRVKTLRDIVSGGNNVPDVFIVYLLIKYIQTLGPQLSGGCLCLEGFPRTEKQLTLWEATVRPMAPKALILVDCDEKTVRAELRDRASVLRAVEKAQGAPAAGEETEENDTAAERRIALFKQLTLPLCKEFDDRKLLRLIDGEKTEEALLVELKQHMQQLAGVKGGRESVASRPVSTPGTRYGSKDPLRPMDDEQLAEFRASLQATLVLVFGPPGAGRSEQLSALCQERGLAFVSVSRMLREHVANSAAAVQQWALATIAVRGEITPQDLALDLLVRELQTLSDREFVFIEGYPRNLEELNTFQETFTGVRVVAIELRCSENVCAQRIGQRYRIEARVDDKPAAARNRIRYYLQHTRPLVELFAEQSPNSVAIVNSEQEIEQVHDELAAAFDRLTSAMSEAPIAKDDAAVKIQAAYRGYRERKGLSHAEQGHASQEGGLEEGHDQPEGAKTAHQLPGTVPEQEQDQSPPATSAHPAPK